MTAVAHEFHSPLTLLREWRDQGAPLREFLVTGYTLDLVFLERHCVSTARGLGARVTVLADGGQAVHDAVDVRHAGRAYQHGQARCRGAFHPKLVVLAGDDAVWVAIGSGNPTMSGWGFNRELWLVVRAPSRSRGPAALRDLGDWLVDLPEVVAMPSWIAETVAHVGRWITPEEDDGSHPRLRVFGNLRRSLLGLLPTGPVDSLRLTAPFFDAKSAAVRALVGRLSPAEVDIAVQPALSQYDGRTLAEATAGVDRVAFRFLAEDRPSHGKLVEWTDGDGTTAMVGSANLSAAALLASTAAGGNCELVATYPVPESLLPEGESATRAVIRGMRTIPAGEDDGRAVVLDLLGARQLPEAVVVELVTTARAPVTIETSPDATPGTWTAVQVVTPTGEPRISATFRVPEQLGAAVRAWVEVDGERVVSSEVFLTDTIRCRPRDDSADTPKLVRDYDLAEVFTDPVLAGRFNADLLRLLSQVREHRSLSATARTPGAVAAVAAQDRWGDWLARTERVLGPSLASLVFPGLSLGVGGPAAGWSIGSDVDEDEDEAGDEDESPQVRASVVPPSQRQAWRTRARHLRRAAGAQPAPPIELRMTVARLHLDLLAAGIWGADESWRAELRDVVRSLVPSDLEADETPSQALSFLGSLGAVCLALLFQDASPHGGGEHDLIAKAAWDAAGEWAAFAEPRLVEGYLYVPDQPYARVAAETEVAAVIDLAEASADDPSAEVRAAFEREGLPVTLVDGVWVVDGDFRNPRRHAAKVATMAGERCVVLARNRHKASLVLRDGRTLVLAESAVPRWRVYRLTPMSTPLSTLGGEDGLPGGAADHRLEPVPDQVRAIADAAGVNVAHLVAALRVGRS